MNRVDNDVCYSRWAETVDCAVTKISPVDPASRAELCQKCWLIIGIFSQGVLLSHS